MATWQQARFQGNRVFARVDATGALVVEGGRVAIRYNAREGTKIYRAGASRFELDPGAAPVEMPDGVDGDAPGAAAPAAKGAKGKVRAPSGFGSAGSRTAGQAAAAAADASRRLADLAEGTIVAYADGSCRGNPGPAGSGAVVVLPDGRRGEASLSLGTSTNNVGELTAIALVLDLLDEAGVPPDAPVAVFSDSSYTDGVLTRGWKAKANGELVAGLRRRLAARPGVRLEWIAGHVGIEGNERADALANDGVGGITQKSWSTTD